VKESEFKSLRECSGEGFSQWAGLWVHSGLLGGLVSEVFMCDLVVKK